MVFDPRDARNEAWVERLADFLLFLVQVIGRPVCVAPEGWRGNPYFIADREGIRAVPLS